MKERHKQRRDIQCVKLLTEPQDLREASFFDIVQVKSGKLLCSLPLDAHSHSWLFTFFSF